MNRRLEEVERRCSFEIEVDGQRVTAYAGETIATVLLASGERVIRRTLRNDEPRGVFCGIGICYDCLVTVDGAPNQRACMTAARPGQVITRQRGLGKMR
jgi:predicted molibdopterin-dependent oxidoreductase YjgC